MKKIFLLLTVVCTLFFVGCGAKKEKLKEINMTYVKSPLNIPSILGRKDKIFENEFAKDDIKVNFYELTTGPEQIQALASGEMDVLYALSAPAAIIGASNGVGLKITGVYTRAPKVFMILTMDDKIKSPKDFVGKKVVGPKGTILHQLLVTYLNTENVDTKDMEFINMGLPGAMSALLSGNADVALLAGPVALNTIKSGAKVVTTGEGLVQGLVVTAMRSDFINENPEATEKFNAIGKEIVENINENFDNLVPMIAEEVANKEEEVRNMYPLYDFSPEIREGDIKDLKDTQKFLLDNKLQEKEIDIESIILK